MAIRYTLLLRTSASPHLYLDSIKEMIKDDDELLPQMRKVLLLMKKWNKSFVQLPLQMEVVISPEFRINLERPLSPSLGSFTKTDWSEKDILRYKVGPKDFLEKVKQLYNKFGYDVEEGTFDDKKVPEIIKSIEEFEKKLLEKVDKTNKMFGFKNNNLKTNEKSF